MDQVEMFDTYLEQNGMWHFEGVRGVRILTQLVEEVCGYTSFDYFLEDNPGAMAAIVDWIREANCPKWRQNLEELVQNS
jgi:hypothetical protein